MGRSGPAALYIRTGPVIPGWQPLATGGGDRGAQVCPESVDAEAVSFVRSPT
jgi:hypothetical protein